MQFLALPVTVIWSATDFNLQKTQNFQARAASTFFLFNIKDTVWFGATIEAISQQFGQTNSSPTSGRKRVSFFILILSKFIIFGWLSISRSFLLIWMICVVPCWVFASDAMLGKKRNWLYFNAMGLRCRLCLNVKCLRGESTWTILVW